MLINLASKWSYWQTMWWLKSRGEEPVLEAGEKKLWRDTVPGLVIMKLWRFSVASMYNKRSSRWAFDLDVLNISWLHLSLLLTHVHSRKVVTVALVHWENNQCVYQQNSAFTVEQYTDWCTRKDAGTVKCNWITWVSYVIHRLEMGNGIIRASGTGETGLHRALF